jgi:hypothetical protein
VFILHLGLHSSNVVIFYRHNTLYEPLNSYMHAAVSPLPFHFVPLAELTRNPVEGFSAGLADDV